MTDDSTAVLAHLRGMSGEMVDLLSRLVDIESPSGEPPSQVPVRAVLVDELEPLGYAVELVDAPEYGDHLVARPTGPAEDRPSQLRMGRAKRASVLGAFGDEQPLKFAAGPAVSITVKEDETFTESGEPLTEEEEP